MVSASLQPGTRRSRATSHVSARARSPVLRQHGAVDVFLETERLALRRFTDNDADLLVELDSDPEVMHFITGGLPTPRLEIETEILPAYLEYYERYAGYGFWAAVERSTGAFVGWFHFRPGTRTIL